ncbi:MAG: polymerase sigma-32 factor [Rhodospirillaceae bacterium]|nr:polymerase sigma-32 factor [Rhodospirillaceae bacterium]
MQIDCPANPPSRPGVGMPRNPQPLQRDTSSYLREIRAFPMLTSDEETRLARRWRQDKDIDAAHRLVVSHLKLVAKIAARYRGYGLPLADLISEGSVGMMRAVHGFDPDRGFRLATYAIWWIRAAIQEYILHNWSLVKIGTTTAQKRLFFGLRRTKAQIAAIANGDLSPDQAQDIASRLNSQVADVVNMDRRLAGPDKSLNEPLAAEGDSQWQDWLVDDRPSQEAQLAEDEELAQRRTLLARGLASLEQREREILSERRLRDEPTKLEHLSHRYGISVERTRQIEILAFQKLTRAIHEGARANSTHGHLNAAA